jgi:hypothetical protein
MRCDISLPENLGHAMNKMWRWSLSVAAPIFGDQKLPLRKHAFAGVRARRRLITKAIGVLCQALACPRAYETFVKLIAMLRCAFRARAKTCRKLPSAGLHWARRLAGVVPIGSGTGENDPLLCRLSIERALTRDIPNRELLLSRPVGRQIIRLGVTSLLTIQSCCDLAHGSKE